MELNQKGLVIFAIASIMILPISAQVDIAPSVKEVNRPFGDDDYTCFKTPSKIYYPETWFHFIGGNISKEGVDADLTAIRDAGFSGVQWFHGDFGGTWPGVTQPIRALTPAWEDAVAHTGQKAKDLGLRFTVQTCPGWAMAGGPWIKPQDAMRNLAWSRTDVVGKGKVNKVLPLPENTKEEWRDYQDICVLAFPTPEGDTDAPLTALDVKSGEDYDWNACLQAKLNQSLQLRADKEHVFTFRLPEGTTLRTVQLPPISSLDAGWIYQPDVRIILDAVDKKGKTVKVIDENLPMSNWQDYMNYDIACNEVDDAVSYKMTIKNLHPISLKFVRLYSAARKNNWRAEAGWTLVGKERSQEHTRQSEEAFIRPREVRDITQYMDAKGNLRWNIPTNEKWTILRVGHVNTGRQNSPAPKEATGWECNKLDPRGAELQFNNYVGHLFDGPLKGRNASGMLMDSWECVTQTWTQQMEKEFSADNGYSLRKWLPALMGYVVDDQETTSKFLLDWRRTLQRLYNVNFFKKMTDLAHEKGLKVQYETAAGDVVPIDIMEYYKYADVPMAEFWQPITNNYVGSLDFKCIKPTASAAHLYGKTRVAAESFTSFDLTWNEHLEMLKDVANLNMTEGVTHNVFHTYTHNPQVDFLKPGTSFGASIGTPFLRGQTWWKYMPEFTRYLARTNYMLERGKPVTDVLWYLGDEMTHRPSSAQPLLNGYKYDFCNPDVLLHRLSVKDGLLCTPEGVSYRVLWIPENERMLPETVEKLGQLISDGATVIGNRPRSIATLKDPGKSARRFNAAVKAIWRGTEAPTIHSLDKGKIISGLAIDQALRQLKIEPDVICKDGGIHWLHRQIDGADWYYVTAPTDSEFHGEILFRCKGKAEEWNAVNGNCRLIETQEQGDYQCARFDFSHAENRFIVFRHDGKTLAENPKAQSQGQDIKMADAWTVKFPAGWGAPDSISLSGLKPWKELDISDEGKAFSGTANYTTTFQIDGEVQPGTTVTLDLGRVDMIADVNVNGHKAGVLWCSPYTLEIGDFVRTGKNVLSIDVTSTWYNRLVFDAKQPEKERKTWTINGPSGDSPLSDSGLIGPVSIKY